MEILIQSLLRMRSVMARLILHCRGVQFEGKAWLRNISIPRNPWDIRLGDGAMLDERVTLLSTGQRTVTPRIIIGAGTYINRDVFIDAAERIEIGRDVLIGPACYITDHDHGLVDRSQLINQPSQIENGAWLGAHVIVLKGVTIGAGAVIAAGSVVTRSVPPGCLAMGSPARVVKKIKSSE
jgi:acetyltransferase-like isoleucine patch superfamily enzyme